MFVVTVVVLALMGGAVFAVLDRSGSAAGRRGRWRPVLVGASSAALVMTLLVAVVQVIRGGTGA